MLVHSLAWLKMKKRLEHHPKNYFFSMHVRSLCRCTYVHHPREGLITRWYVQVCIRGRNGDDNALSSLELDDDALSSDVSTKKTGQKYPRPVFGSGSQTLVDTLNFSTPLKNYCFKIIILLYAYVRLYLKHI